jgi:hypothetical protein
MIRKVSRQKGPKVAALLNAATPIELQPGDPPVVVLAASHDFHLGKLREPASREVIEWAIFQVLEAPLKVRFVLAGGQGQPVKPRVGGNGAAPATNGHRPSATPTMSRPPAPSPAPPAPAPQVRDAAPTYQATPPSPPSPSAADPLEAEVRADPIIQEILRATGAELREVRPLPPSEGE